MDYLWSPWRYKYVSSGGPLGSGSHECLFCSKAASSDDRANYVVLRAEHNFVLLNLYPYTNGHLMIAPYAHVAALEDAEPATLTEMMSLAARAESALKALYKPEGFNLGMNLGHCAGAGVAGHIHMHVLPRWCGDTSFITATGETRVLSEELSVTWERVRAALKE